jgi:hypothetical protein
VSSSRTRRQALLVPLDYRAQDADASGSVTGNS